jgi:hypothetical protein
VDSVNPVRGVDSPLVPACSLRKRVFVALDERVALADAIRDRGNTPPAGGFTAAAAVVVDREVDLPVPSTPPSGPPLRVADRYAGGAPTQAMTIETERLRELAAELGFWPAPTDEADIEHPRQHHKWSALAWTDRTPAAADAVSGSTRPSPSRSKAA